VTDKVLSSGLQTELGVDLLHGALVDIEACHQLLSIQEAPPAESSREQLTLMGSRILLLPVLNVQEEISSSPLFKQTHQRTSNSFHLCRGYL
jgi:hypothetical protein